MLSNLFLDEFSTLFNLLLNGGFPGDNIYRSIFFISSVQLRHERYESTYLAAPKGLDRAAGATAAGLGDERGDGTAELALERGRSSSLRRES